LIARSLLIRNFILQAKTWTSIITSRFWSVWGSNSPKDARTLAGTEMVVSP
jgi:hypothetical protein